MSTSKGTPVVFIHGLWLHADSWEAWGELFREHGYDPIAPGWPGDSDTVEETRKNADKVAGFGIEDVVQHYAGIIDKLESKPIVVGHSFGGLIAQRLLTEGHAVAGVALDPAPIKGVLYLPPSAFRVAGIALKNPANRNKSVSLTAKQFAYGFGNALAGDESDALFDRWAIPSPGKPLFEAAIAAFVPGSPAKVDTKRSDRGPLLITGGRFDHTVPAIVSKQAFKLYHKSSAVTDYHEFPDRGHSLGIDARWREVADYAVDWLGKQSL